MTNVNLAMPLRHLPAGIPALLVRLTTKMAYDGNRQMLADSIMLLRMLLASQVELVSRHVCPGHVLHAGVLCSIGEATSPAMACK